MLQPETDRKDEQGLTPWIISLTNISDLLTRGDTSCISFGSLL